LAQDVEGARENLILLFKRVDRDCGVPGDGAVQKAKTSLATRGRGREPISSLFMASHRC